MSHARLIERHKEVGKTYIKRTHMAAFQPIFFIPSVSRECFNNIYKYDEIEEKRNVKKRERSGELLLNRDLSQGKSCGTTSVRSTISRALSACAFRSRINSRRERALILPTLDYDGVRFMKCFRDENIKLLRAALRVC